MPVPERAGNDSHLRSPTANANDRQPGLAQVDPLPETTFLAIGHDRSGGPDGEAGPRPGSERAANLHNEHETHQLATALTRVIHWPRMD